MVNDWDDDGAFEDLANRPLKMLTLKSETLSISREPSKVRHLNTYTLM